MSVCPTPSLAHSEALGDDFTQCFSRFFSARPVWCLSPGARIWLSLEQAFSGLWFDFCFLFLLRALLFSVKLPFYKRDHPGSGGEGSHTCAPSWPRSVSQPFLLLLHL